FPYGFPEAGDYRIFVQVKRSGRIVTSAFDAHVDSSGGCMLKLFVIGIFLPAGVAAQQADTAPPKPNDYADGKTWLCRPGRQDACAIDRTTTVVAADGKLSKETW